MQRTLITTHALAAVMLCTAVFAQPPDFAIYPGDEIPGQGRIREDRLARLVEYLDLSEAQSAQWEAIATQHRETEQARWQSVAQLREEFRSLAEQEGPDLEQVGQVALDLHRQMETARASREEVFGQLSQILTPEQAERFEALQAARDLAGDRGRHNRRGPRSPRKSG